MNFISKLMTTLFWVFLGFYVWVPLILTILLLQVSGKLVANLVNRSSDYLEELSDDLVLYYFMGFLRIWKRGNNGKVLSKYTEEIGLLEQIAYGFGLLLYATLFWISIYLILPESMQNALQKMYL